MLRNEKGGVSAEFAVALPAIVLVTGVVFGGLALAAERIAIASAASEIARLEARRDTELAAARIAKLPERAEISRSEHSGISCVTVTSSGNGSILRALKISSTGCAANIWATE